MMAGTPQTLVYGSPASQPGPGQSSPHGPHVADAQRPQSAGPAASTSAMSPPVNLDYTKVGGWVGACACVSGGGGAQWHTHGRRALACLLLAHAGRHSRSPERPGDHDR